MVTMNEKGQFFSPDLVLAIVVFVFVLVFFFSASNTIFARVHSLQMQNAIDETAHATLDALVGSAGSPTEWSIVPLVDINYFGLASSYAVLNPTKVLLLAQYLDANYIITKDKLAVGKYDVRLQVIYDDGNIFSTAGTIAKNPQIKSVYERPILVGGRTAVLRAVFSYAE